MTLRSKVIKLSPIPPLLTLLCVKNVYYIPITFLPSLSCLHTSWHAIHIPRIINCIIVELNVLCEVNTTCTIELKAEGSERERERLECSSWAFALWQIGWRKENAANTTNSARVLHLSFFDALQITALCHFAQCTWAIGYAPAGTDKGRWVGSSGRVVGLRYDPAWSQGNTMTKSC